MQHISLSFRRECPDAERARTLADIRRMAGVRHADLLKADATNPEIRRLAIVAVDDPALCEPLAREIASLPTVESASVPARRGLAGP